MHDRSIIIVTLVLLSGCSGVLPTLTGALVPDVAANVQAGRINTQTVGQTQLTDQRAEVSGGQVEQSTGDTVVRTERVERVEIRNAPSPWFIVLLVLGWLLPSPGEMARSIRRWFGYS